ncbi:MAG: MarR family transcriptional regulator [Acidobacteriota bacterium]
MPAVRTDTSGLLDVVNLVAQIVWADFRRSGRQIEPTQWATLRFLARGACSVSELARHKAVSLPTMSKSVDMLARRGWVARVVDEGDRRHTLVQLTAAGRRTLADCRRRAEEVLGQRLAGLSPAEQAQVGDALGLLKRTLEAEA